MGLRQLIVVAAMLSASLFARADTVDAFTVSGEGTGAGRGGLSGTLLIDVTTGELEKLDFNAEGAIFTSFDPSSAVSTGSEYIIGVDDDFATLVFEASTLVNYRGSPIYLVGPNDSYAGSASIASAATPEPSSIALLGTGLLSVVGMLRKRFVEGEQAKSAV